MHRLGLASRMDIPALAQNQQFLTILGNPEMSGSYPLPNTFSCPHLTIPRAGRIRKIWVLTLQQTLHEPNHALVIHEFLVTASVPVRLFARSLGIIAEGKIPP